MKPLLALLCAALPLALHAEPKLGLPLDCTLGEDCFLLNHMDRDPGAGAQDFTCGPLSYDGHGGTDFAVLSFAAMRAGVTVLAAAPGVVVATRDGMPDLGLQDTPADVLAARDCGNGLVIDHGDGWETQYCHLREGSLIPREGDRVAAGDAVGLVGFSGVTEFPHVHLSVRRDGVEIDPFDTDGDRICGADDGPQDDLWAVPPGYQAGGVVTAGLYEDVPEYDAVVDGSAHRTALPAQARALVGWVLMHGVRAGDVVEITLRDPAGEIYDRYEETLERTQAMAMRAAGRRRPDGGWAQGDWQVQAQLRRAGAMLDAGEAATHVSR